MYNHNRRLVLVKKLLSHNNKNIICCILTKQCIYYLLHPSEKWRDAIKFCLFMFCFLPPRKCASCTFSEATAAISAISAFSTHLATALCSRLLQEAGLDPFHISSRPLLRSQRITRCPIVRNKCGGECTRDSSWEFSWEISERSVALESGSQCMRSPFLRRFLRKETLWIELNHYWRRSCENPLMDWRSSWRKGYWSQAWTWFRNFRLCDWNCWSWWNHFGVLWQFEILTRSVREARVPSVFGRQC